MSHKSDKRERRVGREEDEEDYGDYTTRCICGYVHDDGFMVQCDGCSVWQHVECITVSPNNLPDKYLCEICQPRPVDKKRARLLQQKKRDDLSDLDEASPSRENRGDYQRKPPTHPSVTKRRRKQSKDIEGRPSGAEGKKTKRGDGKRGFRKSMGGKGGVAGSGGGGGGGGKMSSIQCLLNAATLLEEEKEGGKGGGGGSWKELWSADFSPWCDKYDTAEHNRFSETIRQFVSSHINQLKSEAVVFGQQEYNSMENHTHPQCSVTEVQRRRMGVVAQIEVPEDELVLEYKGKVSVLSAVMADFSPGARSPWKHNPCPFVYIYDKIGDLDICIDARQYGNLARFIRRSCVPNSELRHFFVGNELHFGVYATHTISVHEEITLPFDFPIERCDYPLECGCGRKNCWVVRAARGRGRAKVDSGEGGEKKGSEKAPPPIILAPPPLDEDSNSSWTSTGGRRKPKGQQQQSSNLIGRLSSGGGTGGEGEGSSDSEEETSERKKKVKSREERKAEAVMKVFQRMEASSQRKRRHLTSEGSVDSDTLSPSSFHPLTPSQRVTAASQRERRGSTGSTTRKPPLPPAKMRLSSVSSNEGVSANDLPDAFSPPVTPRLASLSSPHHPLSSPLPPPSPLPTPPSYTQPPSVRFTPLLHPHYLLMEFPLPLKKAILRQWEADKHNGSSSSSDYSMPRPLWPRENESWLAAGWVEEDALRPRPTGSLKHRWMRRYSEEKEKENISSNTSLVPPKQRMLQRWRCSCEEKELSKTTTTSVYQSNPTIPSLTHISVASSINKEHNEEEPPAETLVSRGSPLFEEFSDGEFDADKDEPEKEEEVEEDGVERKKKGGGSAVDEKQVIDVSERETTPDMSAVLISADKDVVSDVATHQRERAGLESMKEGLERSEVENIAEKSEVVRKARSLEELMSEDMGRVEWEEGEGGRREVRGGGGRSLEELMVLDMMAGDVGGVGGEGGMRKRDGDGGQVFASGDPREGAGQNPLTKTPVKRKINLSEYRSRARKPPTADQRKESTSSEQSFTMPATTSSSYLPSSYTSSHISSSSSSSTSYPPLLPTPSGSVLSEAAPPPPPPPPPPQFEPVSPDETDPPPSLLHEGSTNQRVLGVGIGVMPGHIPLGILPAVGATPLQPPATPTFLPPGSHTANPYGMEPLWTTPQLEPSQDPRRHVMGGASHTGLLPHPQPHLQPRPGAPPSSHVMIPQIPHNYNPARRPPAFHPRPPGGSGGHY